MPEQLTVSDLLASQTERRLTRMRTGIVAEIERLGTELKLVEEALSKKQRGKRQQEAAPVVEEEQIKPRTTAAKSSADGRFEGLSRDRLYAYVVEYGQPVKPVEMKNFLVHKKGVMRTTEAVRVGLIRLARDGRLKRLPDGKFAVPHRNGSKPDSGNLATSEELPGFAAAGVTAPAGSSADVRSD